MIQSKVWNDPRYKDLGESAPQWVYNFVANDPDSASITYDNKNRSGLWTEEPVNQCPRREANAKVNEIWALNRHISTISLDGNTYRAVVEPLTAGYEIIQFLRPAQLGVVSATLLLVTVDGRVEDELKERSPSIFSR